MNKNKNLKFITITLLFSFFVNFWFCEWWKYGEIKEFINDILDVVEINYQNIEKESNSSYSIEFQQAYEYAKSHWLTNSTSIDDADMDWWLTRIAMAKMLSNYAINVLWKIPEMKDNCSFGDVSQVLDFDYDNWVSNACKLNIMWVWMTDFRPYDFVQRAEFATALSRLLFGISDWIWTQEYYAPHLLKLKKEWIISDTNPNLQEKRWYIMLMLMRVK